MLIVEALPWLKPIGHDLFQRDLHDFVAAIGLFKRLRNKSFQPSAERFLRHF